MHWCHTFYIFIVWHIKRMTCRNTFLFIPRNGILCPPFFGIYLFHPLDIAKNESFLGGFAPPATWANHRSVFNGIRFYSFQNIVSSKTQQGMFRVTRNLLGYSWKNKRIVLLSWAILQIIILICLNSSNICQLFIFSDWLSR